MSKRKGINKKDRFEVFKRDSFTCQYCGKSAPDVILHIDHIVPVSKGGENSILNYVTACFDCNIGKKDRELSDNAVIQKQKEQLDQLQERREQLEMIFEWKKSLLRMDDFEVEKVREYWNELFPYAISESGSSVMKMCVKKYGLNEVLESIHISFLRYADLDEHGRATQLSTLRCFDYVSRICYNRKQSEKKPYMGDLYYIRGILNKRFSYINKWKSIELMETAYLSGLPIDEIKFLSINSRNWSDFSGRLEDFISREDGN